VTALFTYGSCAGSDDGMVTAPFCKHVLFLGQSFVATCVFRWRNLYLAFSCDDIFLD
jgi:hypothetical protein